MAPKIIKRQKDNWYVYINNQLSGGFRTEEHADLFIKALNEQFHSTGVNDMSFMIGQRVILTQQGGVKEIGTVVPSETGETRGVWVLSPTRGYASDYDVRNVQPLPGGAL